MSEKLLSLATKNAIELFKKLLASEKETDLLSRKLENQVILIPESEFNDYVSLTETYRVNLHD
jgi:PHD/YefM family antitoxin component YafN of YafNO toxin-antitoxin module